jgi:hypothetical protein
LRSRNSSQCAQEEMARRSRIAGVLEATLKSLSRAFPVCATRRMILSLILHFPHNPESVCCGTQMV